MSSVPDDAAEDQQREQEQQQESLLGVLMELIEAAIQQGRAIERTVQIERSYDRAIDIREAADWYKRSLIALSRILTIVAEYDVPVPPSHLREREPGS